MRHLTNTDPNTNPLNTSLDGFSLMFCEICGVFLPGIIPGIHCKTYEIIAFFNVLASQPCSIIDGFWRVSFLSGYLIPVVTDIYV